MVSLLSCEAGFGGDTTKTLSVHVRMHHFPLFSVRHRFLTLLLPSSSFHTRDYILHALHPLHPDMGSQNTWTPTRLVAFLAGALLPFSPSGFFSTLRQTLEVAPTYPIHLTRRDLHLYLHWKRVTLSRTTNLLKYVFYSHFHTSNYSCLLPDLLHYNI